MAIVRGVAFKVGAGLERCWIYELAWDDQAGPGLDEATARVVGRCERPPVGELLGSGICTDHQREYLRQP
jgi:hypothetical protein